MATKFQIGQQVRQIMPAPIVGNVKEFAFDSTTGDVKVVVATPGDDGVVHERVFHQDAVEAV